ncbi:MAG: hypothetical protein B7Z82_04865 [Halothiobacillus sp. 20-54-6]|nr:MAG: hypothetical protein B7Z82_04865 [Halothiobacillus sp. 20-54-6]
MFHTALIGGALAPDGPLRWVIGVIAGLIIDIKLAGSLSLAISLPTMLVSFVRYSQSGHFGVLKREQPLFSV